MSLLLTLERGPRQQAVQQASLDQGELVIGRSATADWQIDDPDMYVSRTHCTIRGGADGYFVTDNSSSGLFINEASEPLGAGNSVELRNGMRLRLGDYVIWVDVQGPTPTAAYGQPAAPPPKPAASGLGGLGGDDFFSIKVEEEPKPQRPTGLPNPFDNFEAQPYAAEEKEKPRSQAFDDPFSLDALATPAPAPKRDFSPPPASGGFDAPDAWADLPPPREAPAPRPSGATGFDAPWSEPPRVEPAAERAPPPPRPARRPLPPPAPSRQAVAISDEALRDAFLRGLGLDTEDFKGGDSAAQMEKFGREYRLMMEGIMQLLRKRAEEKGNARVAQTIVGASEVNPLKFLPSVDDVMAMLLAERSPGFMAGEPAIQDAVRDLAQHHVRAWRGVQGALRKMIDRFDPAVIEEELKESSAVEKLLAGGRSAKLWELYKKRHREIATNAESRFLGDLGADFRNAYEGE